MNEMPDAVSLRIPIEGSDGRVCGDLGMEWSRWDPLVVEMSVRASSGHAILERLALRTDVRDAFVSPGCLPGMSIGPAVMRGFTALVFQEGGVTLPVIVPSTPLWEFVRATERVVSIDARAETKALDAAFMRAFESAGDSAGG